MAASRTSNSSSTTPGPWQPLTTLFSQPGNCSSLFVSITPYSLSLSSKFDADYVLSGPPDARFSSCQPPGWQSAGQGFSFSPGICPQGWVYHDLDTDQVSINQVTTVLHTHRTTAYCCPGGYDLTTATTSSPYASSYSYTRPRRFCAQNASTGASTTVQLMTAWQVAWNETETSGLPIELPSMTYGRAITTWVPGSKITETPYDNSYPPDHRYDGLVIIAALVPSVSVLLCCLCGFGCYRKRRRRTNQQIGTPMHTFTDQAVDGTLTTSR